MPQPAQTPGAWVEGGGYAWTDEGCVKAFIKCQVDPNSFGTYDQRQKAQEDVRKEYAKDAAKKHEGKPRHPPPCKHPTPRADGSAAPCTCYESLDAYNDSVGKDPEGAKKWILMNSQSGHLSQNALYQGAGEREDPCSNVPPSPGPPPSSGAYGYTDNNALCTDHCGLRGGMEHREICNAEARFANANAGPLTQEQLADGVRQSADVMLRNKAAAPGMAPPVPNPANRGLGSLDKQERSQMVDQARQQMGQGLGKGAVAAAGSAGAAGQAQAQTTSDVAGSGPTEDDIEYAKKCIENAWKQSLKTMKAKAVAEHSAVNRSQAAKDAVDKYNADKKPNPPIKNFMDLPDDERNKAMPAVKADVEAEMKKQEAMGIDPKKAGSATDPPSKKDCRQYQANWLFVNDPNNGLPMSGFARPSGKGGKPAATPADGGAAGGGPVGGS